MFIARNKQARFGRHELLEYAIHSFASMHTVIRMQLLLVPHWEAYFLRSSCNQSMLLPRAPGCATVQAGAAATHVKQARTSCAHGFSHIGIRWPMAIIGSACSLSASCRRWFVDNLRPLCAPWFQAEECIKKAERSR
eukprot:scaffold210364_cov18-Tisochrysis_lutea.AAC.2